MSRKPVERKPPRPPSPATPRGQGGPRTARDPAAAPGDALSSLPAALLEELWQWHPATDRLDMPAGVLALTGYSRAEFGVTVADALRHVAPQDRETLREKLGAAIHSQSPAFAAEFKLIGKAGRHAWLAVRAAIERDASGTPVRVSGTWADVTARVEAEEERDRLFNVSMDLLAVGGFDGFLQQVNPAWVRVLGWSRDDLMGSPIIEFIHPGDQELMKAAFRALAEDHSVAELATRFRCRDGSHRWLSWSSFPLPDRRLVFSVVRDITEQKDAERRLLEYQDRLRALGAQLAVVEERERRQLAVAIHDSLAQQLFAARAKVTLLRYPEKVGDLGQIVDEAIGILDDSMREARSLSFELYPPILHETGLEAALSWLARQWGERTGIECSLVCDDAGDQLDPGEDGRALAYQCVRELLANVAKHAGATSVRIAMIGENGRLVVSVADNGRGVEPEPEARAGGGSEPPAGFGLFSIRERLRAAGGSFRLHSRPGAGCRVEFAIPLPGADRPAPEA